MFKMQTYLEEIIHDELMLLPEQDSDNFERLKKIEKQCEKLKSTLNEKQKEAFENIIDETHLYQALRDYEIICYTIDFLKKIKI